MGQNEARQWAGSVALRVGKNIQRARKDAGKSAQQLSDGCEAVGYPIPRSTIANLESGRKETVSLQELLVIAHVLDIPPITLIYSPYRAADLVEAAPGVERMAVDAAEEFTFREQGASTLADLNEQAFSLRGLEQTASGLVRRAELVRSGEIVPEAARGQRGLDDKSISDLALQEWESIASGISTIMKKARKLRTRLSKAGVTVWDVPEDLVQSYQASEDSDDAGIFVSRPGFSRGFS
ncbi:helix-turn-helix domain-containing protein [Paenarthrobacter ureafaciens]|uniref:helix-turn-helix domain-containing protein n=1 Tax=Paenarthrobacter ureafaciens TaxID=37931 RepID=UPI001C2CA943|nr:helix-turn-helix transcriptional regulator [Paenarthrobacter ureafaciens]UOD81991.1 helix-turn-helix domain-containing protein [Paenarthrobacter ureafaciens]WNZ05483.1 helix-turn-helix transcriptional regulator [Paenarthrobacter ureafaciens]